MTNEQEVADDTHERLEPTLAAGSTETETEKQIARQQLRERCLETWLRLARTRPPIKLHLYEGEPVTAIFNATNAKETHYQVSQLQTPLGTYADALIRYSDVRMLVADMSAVDGHTTDSDQTNDPISPA